MARLAAPAVNDPVLIRFRAALDKLYGERIERVVLSGSRARGDAHPDSDGAVFLKDFRAFSVELDPLVDAETDILYDTGAVINFSTGFLSRQPRICSTRFNDGLAA